MKRLLALILFVVTLQAGYYRDLYCYILHSNGLKVNGEFYHYDFEKNGYDFNDWLYLSSEGGAYRLLGVPPTQDNAFGWQRLSSVPSDLPEVAGYFVYLGFEQDDSRFSWLYIAKDSGKVYKLMGADPTTHYFIYADIDGDGISDALPNLTWSISTQLPGISIRSITFDYSCANSSSAGSCPPGIECEGCWPLESVHDCIGSSSSSSSQSSSSSASAACINECDYTCIGENGSASSIPAGVRYGWLDTPFAINDATVKIFHIQNDGALRLIKSVHTYRAPTEDRFVFDFCTDEGCTLYEPNDYYLVQITEGCNFDRDMNGERERIGAPSDVVLRAIVRGSWIATMRPVVSMVSELAYEKLASFIKYHYSPYLFAQKLQEVAEDILISDISGDGVLDGRDLVSFEMERDGAKLTNIYRDNLPGLLRAMADGRYMAMNMDSILSFVWGGSPAYDIYVEGSTLYTGQVSKIKIVDVSNPKSPRTLHQVDVGKSINTMIKVDRYLYVGTYSGIYKIDLDTLQVSALARGELEDDVTDMALTHDKKIVFIYSKRRKWAILDTQKGDRIYRPDIPLNSASEVFVKMIDGVEYAFFADGAAGLKVVRLTPPENLTHQVPMVWSVDTPGFAKGVWVEGRYAYVADWQEGVQVIDPFAKQIVAHIPTPTLARDVSVQNSLAYVLDKEHGLMIFDLRSLADPKLIGNIDTPLSYAYEVAVAQIGTRKIAFVLEAVKTYLIDVTNPHYKDTTTAAVVAEYRGCPNVSAVVRKGDILYGVGYRNFCTFRVGNDGVRLTLLQKLDVDASLTDLVLAKHTNEVYAVSSQDGLVRFNITNPAQSYLLSKGVPGSSFSRGERIALTPDGNYVVISDANKLHFIHVYSVPPSIDEIFVQVMTQKGVINDMAPVGDGAYLAVLGDHKLSFVDVSRMPQFTFSPIILEDNYFQNMASFHQSKKMVAFDTRGRVYLLEYDRYPTDAQILESVQGERRVGTYMSVVSSNEAALIHTVADGLELFTFDPLSYEGTLNTFGSYGGRFAYSEREGVLFVPDGSNGVAVVDARLFEPVE